MKNEIWAKSTNYLYTVLCINTKNRFNKIRNTRRFSLHHRKYYFFTSGFFCFAVNYSEHVNILK